MDADVDVDVREQEKAGEVGEVGEVGHMFIYYRTMQYMKFQGTNAMRR